MKRDKDKTKAELTQELEEMRQRVNELEVSEAKRKQAEEALQASEEKFSKVFRTSPDSMVITSVRDGKFIEVNDSLTRVMGFTREETIGRTSIEMDIWESPEDRNRIVQMLQQQGEVHELEIKFRNKWGESRDGLFSANLIDIADEPCMIALTTDITERKKAEDILRMSERDLAEAQELAHVGNWRWEIIPDEVYWSDEAYRLFGVEPGEAVDYAKYLSIVLPEDRDFIMKEVQDALDGIKPYENEHRIVRNREIRIHHTKGTVTQDEQGKPIRLFGVVQDITESHRLQEEQARVAKLESVGTLASGIAHDFNNLLTGIMGNIGLAKRHMKPGGKALERLDEAEKAAVRARDLTQQLLTFARGGMPVKKLATISEIIKDTAAFVLSGSNVRLELFIPDDLWTVEVDEGQINQVIHNIVINADEAMPAGGTLHISASNIVMKRLEAIPLPRGNYLRVDIRDEGIGMSEEQAKRIFEPYYTTKQKGSGLGLATAYSIIKNHGGYITAESRQNVGATFHIYLPASKKPTSRREVTEAKKPARGKGKILVMDDEEIIRDMLSKMLPISGYQVELTTDGAEAIKKYIEAKDSGKPFDAVIMDLTIPGGMGGKEATQKLLEVDPDARVIVSSGYSTDPIMSDYKKYGFSAVITKPYSVSQMEETLRGIFK